MKLEKLLYGNMYDEPTVQNGFCSHMEGLTSYDLINLPKDIAPTSCKTGAQGDNKGEKN